MTETSLRIYRAHMLMWAPPPMVIREKEVLQPGTVRISVDTLHTHLVNVARASRAGADPLLPGSHGTGRTSFYRPVCTAVPATTDCSSVPESGYMTFTMQPVWRF